MRTNSVKSPGEVNLLCGGRAPSVMQRIARFVGTRFNGVKGVDLLLRTIHNPDKRQESWIDTIASAYPAGPRYHLESRWFTEWQVLFYGNQDRRIHQWIIEKVRPEWVTFDIGGNFGYYSCLLAGLCSWTHAFEPVSWLADRIEANAKLNKLTNLTINRIALSDSRGEVRLHIPAASDANWGTSSIVHRPSSSNGQFREVRTTTLDEYCDNAVTRMDFVKIDVEGAENLVLRGGRRSIERWRPYMIIECNRESAADVLGILGEMRYRIRPLRGTEKGILSKAFVDIVAEPLDRPAG